MSAAALLCRTSGRGASAAVLALAVVLAGCGGSGASPAPSPTEPASSSPAATADSSPALPSSVGPSAVATLPVPASPVTGVVIDVVASGLADVTGMTLRLDDGRSFEFRIGSLENGAEFPPGHLKEHMATSSPVKVWFRLEGTELVAYRIEDAG